MTKNTEPKTRTPLLRMATGIAAAAAVLAVTGGFGYLLLSMKNDVQRNPTTSELAEQASGYISYFRDYYETRAGHPVDFDFSTLCGTDFDMAWEIDDYTVTLNAAVCDGWQLNYIYTVEPHFDWTPTEENLFALPEVKIQALDSAEPSNILANSGHNQYLDTELREDGTLRGFGSVQGWSGIIPFDGDWEYRVHCLPGNRESTSSGDVISVNIPDEIPECRALTGRFSVNRNNGEAANSEFVYGIVTPLGITLTNYNPPELQILLAESVDMRGGSTISAEADSVTVQKCISENDLQDVALTYLQKDAVGAIGDFSVFYITTFEFSDGTCDYTSLELPFTEPQDLKDILYLCLGSNAQEDIATIPVNPAANKDEEQLNDPPETDETPTDEAPTDFPRFDLLSEEQRTQEYAFGSVIAESIFYDENGNPVIDFTIIPSREYDLIAPGDTLSMRIMPVGYDHDGNRYQIHNDEITQGFKWTTAAQADENGAYHVQLTLDPLTKEYYYILGEGGMYVSVTGDPDTFVPWEYLNIALYLNAVHLEHADGSTKTMDMNTDSYPVKTMFEFRFGAAAYIPFEALTEAQRTRAFDSGTARLDNVLHENNTLTLNFSLRLNDTMDTRNIQPGDTVTFVLLPLCYDSNYTDEISNGSSYNTDGCASAEPDADGWYHFTMSLQHDDASPLLVDCRLNVLTFYHEGGDRQTIVPFGDSVSEEGDMYHLCRFTVD